VGDFEKSFTEVKISMEFPRGYFKIGAEEAIDPGRKPATGWGAQAGFSRFPAALGASIRCLASLSK